MIETMGIAALWGLALIMVAVFPVTELARGMASNPSEHRRSDRGCLISMLGLALMAVLLAGCASSTPPVEVKTIEVKVPVAVQPITPAQVPPLPAPLAKRPANTSAALDLALAKVCEFVSYALRADPLLRISAGSTPVEVPKYPECEGR